MNEGYYQGNKFWALPPVRSIDGDRHRYAIGFRPFCLFPDLKHTVNSFCL